MASLEHRKTPLRLVSTTASQSSSFILSKTQSLVIPALFIKMSILLNSFRISSNAFITVSALDTSSFIPIALTPSFVSLAAVSLAASLFMSAIARLTPFFANPSAIASPMPRAPPVIIPTMPLTSIIYYLLKKLALILTKSHSLFQSYLFLY